jgi:hypothetical protein
MVEATETRLVVVNAANTKMSERSNQSLIEELEVANNLIAKLKEENQLLTDELDEVEGRLDNEYDPKELTKMYQAMCTELKSELDNAKVMLETEKD